MRKPRIEIQGGLYHNAICLPILNCARGYANLLCRFSLPEAEIKAALSEMVPEGV